MINLFRKNKYLILSNIFVFLILISPFIVNAQGQGIVSCTNAWDCNFSELLKTFNNVIRFIIQLGIAVFAIILAWAGFKYITAGGKASQISEAHDMLWVAVKGFVVLLLAYLIVELIFSTLGAKQAASPFN